VVVGKDEVKENKKKRKKECRRSDGVGEGWR
jgi:hypothetical protein